MNRHVPSRWRALLLLSVLAGAVLALSAVACGDDDDEDGAQPTATEEAEPTEAGTPAAAGEIPTVDIQGADYTFQAPESIPGGVTRIHFTNLSPSEDHQAQLGKLNEGVTFEQFTAALPEGEAAILALVTPAGGPGAGPELENENVLDLEPGQYVLVCFIPSPSDGIPHVAKGMIQELEVTEPAAEQPEPPAGDVAVGLSDFAFDAPDTLAAGETTFDVNNSGPQPHEMALARLEGIPLEQFLEFVSAPPGEGEAPEGPPPFTFVGQVAVLGNGLSGSTTIELEAGTYAMLCFVTDPESGAPHAALGMAKEIAVE